MTTQFGFSSKADKDHWVEKLLWQAPPYKEISGAFGDIFLTTILPGENTGAWRAVAIHGRPWCMSRFSGFEIDVLAPTNVPNQPRVVWHTMRGYSRGDFAERLRSTGNVFEFRTNVPALSSEGYERTVVFRYSVSGDRVRRIGPIAVNGQGFVAEWLEAPWSEAEAFSDPANLTALKLTQERFGKTDAFNHQFGPVLACHDSPKHFQLELHAHDAQAGDFAGYYQVQENGEGYTMMVADSPKPDPRCTGPDLMKKH